MPRPNFSRYHDQIHAAVNNHNANRTNLKTKDIIDIVQSVYAHIPADEIQPSDHCSNHTNKAPCDCSGTDRAIFEKVGERGRGFLYDIR